MIDGLTTQATEINIVGSAKHPAFTPGLGLQYSTAAPICQTVVWQRLLWAQPIGQALEETQHGDLDLFTPAPQSQSYQGQ